MLDVFTGYVVHLEQSSTKKLQSDDASHGDVGSFELSLIPRSWVAWLCWWTHEVDSRVEGFLYQAPEYWW